MQKPMDEIEQKALFSLYPEHYIIDLRHIYIVVEININSYDHFCVDSDVLKLHALVFAREVCNHCDWIVKRLL